MYSSRMRTARSLLYEGLCPEGVSVQGRSLARGVSVRDPLPREDRCKNITFPQLGLRVVKI